MSRKTKYTVMAKIEAVESLILGFDTTTKNAPPGVQGGCSGPSRALIILVNEIEFQTYATS